MRAKNLTPKGVERLRPTAERTEYPDALTPGLRLIVQPSGAKSWAVRTRVGGRPIKFTVGPYPAFDVDDAREAAKAALKAAARGEDPRVLRKAAAADTVEAVVAEWLRRDQKKNRSHEGVKKLFDREVLPRWKGRALTSITRRDCVAVVDAVADRGAATQARRVHAYLHRFLRWSVGRDLLPVNPMADLPKPGAENPRDRVLSDAELVEVLRAAAAIGCPAVNLLALTGARKREIADATRGELRDGALVLAGARTKTGEPRSIPLSRAALAVVEGLPKRKPAKGAPVWLFTNDGATAATLGSKVKRALDAELLRARRETDADATPPEPWRLHDLRRTVATGLQRLGFRLEVIEAVLGHVAGSRAGIVGVYQRHAFEDEKRRALEAWGAHVEALLTGRAAPVNVVDLPRTAA